MIVMKFGGSSVANRVQIEKVLDIVRGQRHRRPVVVCSAHKGITDALIDAARAAAVGRYAPESVIARQRAVAASLDCDESLLAPFYDEISDLLRGISLVREHTETIRPPRARTRSTANLRKRSEEAPRHCGSLGGKCVPISPSASAPRIASTSACKATSASE